MHEPDGHLKSLSLPSLLARLTTQIGDLVHAEMELAKREVLGGARRFAVSIAYALVAVVLALLALVALTITAIVALASVMPDWQAAAIVALTLVASAAICAAIARSRLTAPPPLPERALATLKEDVEWAKTRVASSSK